MSDFTSVTIYDVATLAGVSAMTVSRVLNTPSRVADATRERVQEAIDSLGYVPNTLARGLRSATRTLALIVPDISNPFFTGIVHGVEEVAWVNGYAIFLGNTHSSAEQEARYLQKFVGHGIDGLLIAASGDDAEHLLPDVSARSVPIVLVDALVEGVEADTVTSDNAAGARALTEHLLSLGHELIAFIGGRSDISTARERERGYRQALQARGLALRASYCHNTDFSREAAREATRKLVQLDEPPTAIFAASNTLAVGTVEALRALRLRVPEDIALVCFEDLELASALDPFLTVSAQPARDIGRVGTKFLLERIENPNIAPRTSVLEPRLIVRRSCGSQA